jgi:hypothetical protein
MKTPLSYILTLLAALTLHQAALGQADWQTRAELSGYRETSRYEEAVRYCSRLDEASTWATFTTFGTSPEGRSLPLLILSRDGVTTPEAARRVGKPVVLIQNGIHAGEIAGKEASLALAREIVVTRSLAALLDNATILIVPILNVDGHERFGPYNRINQNGPAEMGWRATAQNLNLNRDYIKADAPEMRALLALFNAWSPALYIDNHVTDGADFRYDLLYTIDSQAWVAPEIARWVEETFQPRVRPALEAKGHVVAPYFELRDTLDIAKGIETPFLGPRYSNGYGAIRNRPTILVETHMLKSFEARIAAHYDLMLETLREVNRDPSALVGAIRAADQATVALGGEYDPSRRLGIGYTVDDTPTPIVLRGHEYRHELSEISGDVRVIYGSASRDIETVIFAKARETAAVSPPTAYVVPRAWSAVIERLRAHGLRLERLVKPVTGEFETYRLSQPSWAAEPFEGRHRASFQTEAVRERFTVPAGSVVVPLAQPGAKVAVHLLEPGAPDSLASWGFFDAIFETKEYGEHYMLEALAREMLEKDPTLRAEFQERLRADPAFRANPEARLGYFYERSPFRDARKGLYPVLRVTGGVALEMVPEDPGNTAHPGRRRE